MQNYRKILVVCPAGAVTGGPEALHQLTAHMNSLGLPAYMCYMPFSAPAKPPAAYESYQTQSATYEDIAGNLIIFPEVAPALALKVKHAKAALWWLSLENFLERRHISPLRDRIRYFKRVLQRRRPWGGAINLKSLLHFSQSEHSSQYLRSCGIKPIPLVDSIHEDFLTDKYLNRIDHKENIIFYNPTKGWHTTKQLISRYPEWKFLPLKGLNRDQLSANLYKAKLYIDFGHHPGKDRLPREAAMHGCCLITGLLGSARNDIDLPIPQHYKMDSSAPNFVEQFGMLTNDVMTNFPAHFARFKSYREGLMVEPSIFKEQLRSYFLGP